MHICKNEQVLAIQESAVAERDPELATQQSGPCSAPVDANAEGPAGVVLLRRWRKKVGPARGRCSNPSQMFGAFFIGTSHTNDALIQVGWLLLPVIDVQVFELLVQAAAAEQARAGEACREQEERAAVETQLSEHKVQVELLRHSCSDREAQIKLHQANADAALEALEVLRAQHAALSVSSFEHTKAVKLMANWIQNTAVNVDATFHAVNTRLTQLELYIKRVAFALGRVQTIGHFLERRAILDTTPSTAGPLQDASAATGENSTVTAAQLAVSSQLDEVIEVLQAEVDELSRERAHLISKSRDDAAQLESRVEAARADFADELVEARRIAAMQEQSCSNMALELEQFKAAAAADQTERGKAAARCNEEHAAEISRFEVEVAALKAELSRVKAELDQTTMSSREHVAMQLATAGAAHATEKGQLLAKLHAAEAEIIKSRTMREQAERDAARAREQAAESENTRHEDLRNRLSKAETQLRSVTAERNVLIANLRKLRIDEFGIRAVSAFPTAIDVEPRAGSPGEATTAPLPPAVTGYLNDVDAAAAECNALHIGSPGRRTAATATAWQPAPVELADPEDRGEEPRRQSPVPKTGRLSPILAANVDDAVDA